MGIAADRIGLPAKPFLYTIDQIAQLLSLDERAIRTNYLFYHGKSVGFPPRDKLIATDISPDDAEKPEWRVTERDLIRWMRFKGFRYYERGYVK